VPASPPAGTARLAAVATDNRRLAEFMVFCRAFGVNLQEIGRETESRASSTSPNNDDDRDDPPVIEGYDEIFERVVALADGNERFFQDAIHRVSKKHASSTAAHSSDSHAPRLPESLCNPFSDAYFDDDEAFFWVATFHDSHRDANRRLSPWPMKMSNNEGVAVFEIAAREGQLYATATTMTAHWLGDVT
jgi:hypothetical protein